MSEPLLPCPFCGGQAALDKTLRPVYPDFLDDPDAYAHFIRCRSCAAQGGWMKNVAGAVRNWNRRAR